MKLKNHPGFKRLAVVITLASFVITYFLLLVSGGRISDEEALVEFPIASVVIALITFVFVVDGFKKVE